MAHRRTSLGLSLPVVNQGNDSKELKESIFELKEVHNLLKYEWPQCLQPDANPIELAVSLLDDTSVGLAHKLPMFEDITIQTESALRKVVNDHFEIFNNSVGSYHSLLSTLTDSQNDSKEIKQLLESTTKDIHNRSDVLNELSQTSARYSETIEILDAISELSSIPDQIDQLVNDKKIHKVYDLISNLYSLAEKYNLWTLPALNGIQNYLDMQSNNLFDMIMNELQSEIYLRNVNVSSDHIAGSENYYWEVLFSTKKPQLSSFKTLVTELTNLEKYIHNSANLDVREIADCFSEAVGSFINSRLPLVHDKFMNKKESKITLLDSTLNDVSLSFHYIYMLLNTAFRLNRLQQVSEILTESCQQELHNMINKTTEEIKIKNSAHVSKLSKLQNIESHSIEVLNSQVISDGSVILIQQLFSSIFVKFLAVLQKHKLVEEIITRIDGSQKVKIENKRESYSLKDSKAYDFSNIWNMMKKELKSLMNSYIQEDLYSSVSLSENIVHSSDHKGIHEILKKRALYKFEDVDFVASKKNPEEIKSALQQMFPGFTLADNKLGNELVDSNSPYIVNESYNGTIEVLVPKSIFNMRIILDFFLIFISGSQVLFVNFENIDELTAPFNKLSLQFFEEFMKVSFLGNFKESLLISFKNIMGVEYLVLKYSEATSLLGFKTALISIEEELNNDKAMFVNASTHSSSFIYKNALEFRNLFINACSNLHLSLMYRPEFTDIVLEFLQKFCDVYTDFYTRLFLYSETSSSMPDFSSPVSNRPEPLLSVWMQLPSLTEISENILMLKINENKEDLELLSMENETLLFENDTITSVFDISKDDFLDNEAFDQVCNLFLTSSWILSWLPQLKKISPDNAIDESVNLSTIDRLKDDWCFLENGVSNIHIAANAGIEELDVYLTLNNNKALEFNEIIQSFEFIKNNALMALRFDLRCKAIYYIGKSFKQDDWLPNTEPSDSDHYIGQLSKEIFSTHGKLNKVLSSREIDAVYTGLSEFLDKLLICGAELISKVNNNGIKKIMLNILTIQRMLRNLVSNPESIDFSKSSVYFDLFTLNEYAFINTIKNNEYNFTAKELNNMTRLIYSEKLADGKGSSFNKSKYNDLLRKIEEALTVS